MASSLPRLLHKPLPISRSAVRKAYKAATKKVMTKQIDMAKHIRKTHQFNNKFKLSQFEEMANTLLR
jgi:hypothetical protein